APPATGPYGEMHGTPAPRAAAMPWVDEPPPLPDPAWAMLGDDHRPPSPAAPGAALPSAALPSATLPRAAMSGAAMAGAAMSSGTMSDVGPDDLPMLSDADDERTARLPTGRLQAQPAPAGYRDRARDESRRLSDFTQLDPATLPHRVPS